MRDAISWEDVLGFDFELMHISAVVKSSSRLFGVGAGGVAA